jgi:formamidopyrimidine-DNA glycosylase
MPELPEVETMRRGLARELEDVVIRDVAIAQPDILMDGMAPRLFASKLKGRRIEAVDRRGKNLLVRIGDEAGGTRYVLLSQVRMTGRFCVAPASDPAGSATEGDLGWSHIAARFHLEDGRTLLYDDIRRLGGFRLLSPADWQAREAELGPEPLADGFTPERLRQALSTGRAPIKNALLDQRRLVGVGNIYASESLHVARIAPERPSSELSEPEVNYLHAAIREVLGAALDASGTSLRDYRAINGQSGKYQDRLRVYDREGRPCGRCGGVIRRSVQAGRSTYACPGCQR